MTPTEIFCKLYAVSLTVLSLLLAPGVQAFAAAPYIQTGGVLNAASLVPRGLPSGSIAQGSLVRILGSSLGPVKPVVARAYPLPYSLAGVTVTATPSGGVGYACLTVYVSDVRIEAVLPSNIPLGEVSFQVGYNGAASNPSPATVAAHSPGLFSVLDTGYGPGAIFNFPLILPNSLNNPTSPGGMAVLWTTGLGGSSTPDNLAPPAVPQPVQAFVGNLSAPVVTVYRPLNQAAVDAIVIQIPSPGLTGCYVPVQIKSGSAVSNVVTMAVSSHGSCSDPANPFTAALRSGGNLGTIGIVHTEADLASDPGNGVYDQAFATFQTRPAQVNNLAFDRLHSLPPPGSCTLYNGRGNLVQGEGVAVPGPGIDAGALTLQGGANSQALNLFLNPDFYFGLLSVIGFNSPPYGSMPLNPGNYTMQATGAANQVGAFQVTTTLPGPPAWISPVKLAPIPRSLPLNVTWAAPAGGQVVVVGGDYDITRDASAVFVCAASSSAGSLSIPVEILSAIPPLNGILPNSGRIHLGFLPAPAPFVAAGLRFGEFLAPSYLTREVIFQ